MKKLLFVGAIALSMFTVSAQNKMGYINANELMGSMPEAAKAQADLQEFQQSLQLQYQDLTLEFSAKDSIFNADSLKMSPSMKEIKRKEIITKFQEIQGFEQKSRQMMEEKQQEKVGPIREKAITTIRAVAKENGFTYVFNEETLLVAPVGDNLLPLVKAKLGIKDAAPKPAGAAPARPAGARPATGVRK
jgi:outer membrane protein